AFTSADHAALHSLPTRRSSDLGRADGAPQPAVHADEPGSDDECRRPGLRGRRQPLGPAGRTCDVHPGHHPGGRRGRHRPGDPAAALSPLQHPGCGCCQRDARMNLLFLTLLFPLLGYLILAFSRARFPENLAATVGVGSVGLAALTSTWIALQFMVAPPEGGAYTQQFWQWLDVAGLQAAMEIGRAHV